MYRGNLLLLILGAVQAGAGPLSRNVLIVNEADEITVDWVNPQTGETVSYWKGGKGEQLTVDSFVNHTFLIRPSNITGSSACSSSSSQEQQQAECLSFPTITVSEEPSAQIFHIREGLKVFKEAPSRIVGEKSRLLASDIVFNCKLDADVALFKNKPIREVYKKLADCLESRTATLLEQKQEELAFEADLRKRMAFMAENYTCTDPTRETSKPIRETTWTYKGVTRKVGILHDRPASQIHIIHDFISEDECRAIEKEARSTLHRGTVADGKVS